VNVDLPDRIDLVAKELDAYREIAGERVDVKYPTAEGKLAGLLDEVDVLELVAYQVPDEFVGISGIARFDADGLPVKRGAIRDEFEERVGACYGDPYGILVKGMQGVRPRDQPSGVMELFVVERLVAGRWEVKNAIEIVMHLFQIGLQESGRFRVGQDAQDRLHPLLEEAGKQECRHGSGCTANMQAASIADVFDGRKESIERGGPGYGRSDVGQAHDGGDGA
jgi:hypothetical protein